MFNHEANPMHCRPTKQHRCHWIDRVLRSQLFLLPISKGRMVAEEDVNEGPLLHVARNVHLGPLDQPGGVKNIPFGITWDGLYHLSGKAGDCLLGLPFSSTSGIGLEQRTHQSNSTGLSRAPQPSQRYPRMLVSRI